MSKVNSDSSFEQRLTLSKNLHLIKSKNAGEIPPAFCLRFNLIYGD